MESVGNKEELNKNESKFKQEIHSKVIRAGRRTYFFDVKSTRNNEYYLTITESKKRFAENGKFTYEKHKIFLYREDFNKFLDCLEDVVAYIEEEQPNGPAGHETKPEAENSEVQGADEMNPEKKYTNVSFDDI